MLKHEYDIKRRIGVKRKAILFTERGKADFLECDLPEANEHSVLVKTEFSAISSGTEKANLLGLPNTYGDFPRTLGYSSTGIVLEIGNSVTTCKPGDRVIVYHGIHSSLNLVNEDSIIKIPYDELSMRDCSFVLLAAMGLGGLRKTRLEIGESGIVFGMGILGIFSLLFMKMSGAIPVIAADLSEKRRELAIKCGADYAFDPSESDFYDNVKEITDGKGVSAIVEVTGSAKALLDALNCAAYQARISLLGCTRISDVHIDYYTQVHKPGIELIGAHNFVRPAHDSYPYHWTNADDCNAIMKMMKYRRIDFSDIITETVYPQDAANVYQRMLKDKDFPTGIVFDWESVK